MVVQEVAKVMEVCASHILFVDSITNSLLQPPKPLTTDGIGVALAFLPFYHTYGLHGTMFRFVVPFTHLIMPRWDLDLALDLIQKSVFLNLI